MFKKSYSKLVLSIFFLSLGLFQYQYAQAPDTLWTKTYGGIANDWGESVQQTTDEGYIITGSTVNYGAGGADVWLIKTNASGDTLWTKTFGGVDDDYGKSVQQTTDEGYIITGITESFGPGDFDVWLIKTNVLGDTVWTKTFGGIDWDYGYSVQQTTDEGYIITGLTRSFGAGECDVWLIKTDSLGDTLWTKAIGGGSMDEGNSVQQTTDEGYIVTGRTSSFGPGTGAVYLIKTDTLGDTLWTKAIGGGSWDEGHSIQQTTDGGYIITGFSSSFGAIGFDVLLIKTNASGDTLWTKVIGGYDDDNGYSVQQTTDGGYIITGTTQSFGAGGCDVWLIKTGSDPGIVEHGDQSNISGNCVLKQNYPNPFNALTSISYSISHSDFITLTIYDILGREVKTLVNGFKKADKYSVNFDATKLSNGLYFYELKVGDNVAETKKMLLLR